MNKKNLTYLAISIVGLTTLSIATAGTAFADTMQSRPGQDSLIQALVTRFNLNQNEVQQVFDNQKKVMEAKHEERQLDRLAQAVKNGKLTQDQVNKITTKQAELKAGRATFEASLQGKTKAEIKTAMKAQMDAVKQWAKDNNIPIQYLMPGKGMSPGFGHGGFRDSSLLPRQ